MRGWGRDRDFRVGPRDSSRSLCQGPSPSAASRRRNPQREGICEASCPYLHPPHIPCEILRWKHPGEGIGLSVCFFRRDWIHLQTQELWAGPFLVWNPAPTKRAEVLTFLPMVYVHLPCSYSHYYNRPLLLTPLQPFNPAGAGTTSSFSPSMCPLGEESRPLRGFECGNPGTLLHLGLCHSLEVMALGDLLSFSGPQSPHL